MNSHDESAVAEWNLKATTPPPPGFDQHEIEHPKTPPPPGFRESDGIQLREMPGGASSAPPPPGFNSGPAGRKSLVSELFLSHDDYAKASDLANPRTSSFANLAAMVGTGLAESLEDTLPSGWKGDEWDGIRQPRRSLTDNAFDPSQDISFARMSRHAAARLLGSSPPQVSDSLSLDVPASTPAPASLLSSALNPASSKSHLNGGSISGGGSVKSAPAQEVITRGLSRQRSGGSRTHNSYGLPESVSIAASAKTEDLLSDFKHSVQPRGANIALNTRKMQPPPSTSKDVGLTAMEPPEEAMSNGRHSSRNYEDHVREIDNAMKGLWIGGDETRSAVSLMDQSIGNSSVGSSGSANEPSPHKSEAELRPFIWDGRQSEASRTIVILRTSGLHISDVRTTCEAFGVIETFRADFAASRGIVFVGYYDIRSAQFAAAELKDVLQQLADAEGLVHNELVVQYCVPLNSSTQFDESRIVLSDVPPEVGDNSLASMLSSYGSVRTLTRYGGHYGGSSYEVEYHNVQDAKQALLELASSQPWGANVAVEEAMRAPVDRKRGRELLALFGRWRHGPSNNKVQQGNPPAPRVEIQNNVYHVQGDTSSGRVEVSSTASSARAVTPPADPRLGQPTQQFVMGPDGRYSVVLNQSGYSYGQQPKPHSHSQPQPHSQPQSHSQPHTHSQPHPHTQPQPHSPHLQAQSHPNSQPPHSTHQHAHPPHQLGTSPHQLGTSPHQLGTSPHHLGTSPHHLGTSPHQLGTSPHQHATSPHHPHPSHAPPPPPPQLPSHPHAHPHPHSMEPHQQQIIHGPQGVTYITSVPAHASHHAYPNPQVYWHHPAQPPPPPHSYPATTVVTTSPYVDGHGQAYLSGGSTGVPYYTHVVTAPVESAISNGGQNQHPQAPHTSSGASSGGEDKDHKHLVLDLEATESGRDVRTSLMVRNIPNKYSQQMLLNEFTENGLGPGVIDFFYLPIDFKNRCNRGYAFINFVDFKDILPFHRRYFGKHWSTFNSDKICDITYARIQGKAAMLKRFENSALMEKDEEYKPLVFVSHGPEKGKRLPFPELSKKTES